MKRALIGFVLVVIAGVPLGAQPRTRLYKYCFGGDFAACVRAKLTIEPGDPVLPGAIRRSNVTLSLQNGQRAGAGVTPIGWKSFSIGGLFSDVSAYPVDPRWQPGSTFIADVAADPSFTGDAGFRGLGPDDGYTLGGWWWHYLTVGGVGYVDQSFQLGDGALTIYGCVQAAPGPDGLYNLDYTILYTCGEDAWVTYVLDMPEVEFTDGTVAGGSLLCGNLSCPRVAAAPEPTSMLLLATGLAGLAGVRTRRRSVREAAFTRGRSR